MVFPQIPNTKVGPNGAGVFIICLANSRHVKFTIEMLSRRQTGFFKSIPTIHVLLWVDSFSNEQFALMVAIVFKPKELVIPFSQIVN